MDDQRGLRNRKGFDHNKLPLLPMESNRTESKDGTDPQLDKHDREGEEGYLTG